MNVQSSCSADKIYIHALSNVGGGATQPNQKKNIRSNEEKKECYKNASSIWMNENFIFSVSFNENCEYVNVQKESP